MRSCARCPRPVDRWHPPDELMTALHDLTGTIGTLAAATELCYTGEDQWLPRHAHAAREQAELWHDLIEPARLGEHPATALHAATGTTWTEHGPNSLRTLLPTVRGEHQKLHEAGNPARQGLAVATAVAWAHHEGHTITLGCDRHLTVSLRA